MDEVFQKIKLKTLTWCIEDWTDLHAIYFFVEEFNRSVDPEFLKNTTLKTIHQLLEKNFIVAGDLEKDDTFIPWDIPVEEIVFKIKQKWDCLGRELIPHEIVWFEITEKGKKEFKYLNNLSELKEKDPFYFDDE